MSKKKKRILAVIGVAVVFALIGVLLAYLYVYGKAVNQLQIGVGDGTIDEEFKRTKLQEGYNVYQKIVPIENTGENPCFVRVFMDFWDSSVIGTGDGSDTITTYFSNADQMPDAPEKINDDPVTYGTISSDWKPAAQLGWLPDNWVYINDEGHIFNKNGDTNHIADEGLGGYYYYLLPLDKGESTDPIIKWVMTYFKEGKDITEYDILVYAETIQTVGIDGTEYVKLVKSESPTSYQWYQNDSNAWTEAWKKYLRMEAAASAVTPVTHPFSATKDGLAYSGNEWYNNNCYTTDHAESLTTFKEMFSGNDSLKGVKLTNIDLSNVTSMKSMFNSCSVLEEVTLIGSGFGAEVNYNKMFSGTALKKLTIGSTDGSLDGESINRILASCPDTLETLEITNGGSEKQTISISELCSSKNKLETVTLQNFAINGADSAFENCTALTTLNLQDSTLSGSAANMFKGCTALTALPVSNYSGISIADGMYQGCTGLTTVQIGTPDVLDTDGTVAVVGDKADFSNMTSTKDMFSGCSNLTSLIMALKDADELKEDGCIDRMVTGCTSLSTISLTGFDRAKFKDGFLNINQYPNIKLSEITIEGDLSALHSFRSILTGETNNPNTTIVNEITQIYRLINKAENGSTEIKSAQDAIHKWSKLQTLVLMNFEKINSDTTTSMNWWANLEKVKLKIDLSEVTEIGQMFGSCNKLAYQPLRNIILDWKFSKEAVTNMQNSTTTNPTPTALFMNVVDNKGTDWIRCENGWIKFNDNTVLDFISLEDSPEKPTT